METMLRLDWSRSGALLLVVFSLMGCGSVPGLSAARRADYQDLERAVKTHEYKPRQVRRLAQAVLSAEVRRARDRVDRPFVRGLQACAPPVERALRARAKSTDGVAAEAILVLMEAGLWNKGTKRYHDAEDGAFRALAARATEDSPRKRRDYFVDADERVRQAALLAARDARDVDDIAELLEVARLDPNRLARNRALLVLGTLGDETVARALAERYDQADEELRLAIVDAWSQPSLYAAGGRKHLVRLLARDPGTPTVVAARRLTRDPNPEVRNVALTRLVRFITEGSQDEKRLALQLLPLTSQEAGSALLTASQKEEPGVSVIAWARLLGHPAYHARAEQALLDIAAREHESRLEARAALAASGSAQVLPLLREQAKADDATTRAIAAAGLVRLGAWAALPTLLADSEATVRRETACRILARPYTPAL